MGWFFRRSAKFGPFRLNFSKSGIGVSAGIRGARISTGPRGSYVNLGRHGVFYRQKIGGGRSSGSATRTVNQLNNNPIPSSQSLPSNLNYPTFPAHGLPRIVTTLGILCVPTFLIVYVWALFTLAPSSTQLQSNDNSRSVPATAPVQSSRQRGFQAGSAFALSAGGQKTITQRRLKLLAGQMALTAKEDQDWQSGWIDGYKNGIDSLNTHNSNDTKPVTHRTPLQKIAPLTFVPTPNVESNGYMRGPRGGCYYFSASGRKVYVDRGLCN